MRTYILHRVLIVEDDLRTATLYRTIIVERWPHAVVDVVGCAESALLCIRQAVYDVIVCDVRLPQLNGLSALIANRLFQPSTPVVIVTGYEDRALDERAARLGAYVVMHKPIEADHLIETLQQAVPREEQTFRQREKNPAPLSHSAWISSEPERITIRLQQMLDKWRCRLTLTTVPKIPSEPCCLITECSPHQAPFASNPLMPFLSRTGAWYTPVPRSQHRYDSHHSLRPTSTGFEFFEREYYNASCVACSGTKSRSDLIEFVNPDAHHRDHLANERTFLAWLRTSLAFLAFGLLVERLALLLPYLEPSLSGRNNARAAVIGMTFMWVGMGLIPLALWRFLVEQRDIGSPKGRSSTWTFVILTLTVTALAGILTLSLTD